MGVMLQGHSQSIAPDNKKQNKPKAKSKANNSNEKLRSSKSMFSWGLVWFF